MAASDDTATTGTLTVDELARHAGLPVRTIREYQTMRLLPPPTRRGRVGLYGDEHRRRLELIARLQRRGYSLAGIKDLLEAWDAGAGLQSLLGVDVGPAALDETPMRLTRRQLADRLPALSKQAMRRAADVGLVQPIGRDQFMVRSPALLTLVSDGVGIGVPIGEMLDLVGLLRDELGGLANTVIDAIVDRVWQPLASAGRSSDVEVLLRRGRLLLLQGVVSTLANGLGEALARHIRNDADGDELGAVVGRVRIGAVADAEGNVRVSR